MRVVFHILKGTDGTFRLNLRDGWYFRNPLDHAWEGPFETEAEALEAADRFWNGL